MTVDVRVPPVGESVTEGVLVEWLRQTGDVVGLDEPLFTLETDKVTITINAAVAGRLTTRIEPGSTVRIGEAVASIDPEVARAPAPARPSAPPADSAAPLRKLGEARRPEVEAERRPITTPAGAPQMEAKLGSGEGLSPAARRIVDELTESSLRAVEPGAPSPVETDQPARLRGPAMDAGRASTRAALAESGAVGERRQTREPLSPLRQRIAERLVQACNETAMVTTFNEVDMTNVMALRSEHREAFRAKHGVDLGLMSFFVKAVVDGLQSVPQLNCQIQGDQLIHHHYYDIGIAVSSEHGLVVPVLRDADQRSLAELEQSILALARKVRDRSITLAELAGGVFTLSNGGVFGSLLSTPILNPPQAGILGMHAIKKRPVVIDDQIAIRPMMYLALSYDHRIVDGQEAVTFLTRVVSYLQSPGFTLLGI